MVAGSEMHDDVDVSLDERGQIVSTTGFVNVVGVDGTKPLDDATSQRPGGTSDDDRGEPRVRRAIGPICAQRWRVE